MPGQNWSHPSDRLSERARDRLSAALRLVDGIEAVAELAALIDPDGVRPWAAAVEIAARLRRFERGGAFKHIAQGHREPRNRVEALLMTIALSDIGRTKERLYDLLRPHDAHRQ